MIVEGDEAIEVVRAINGATDGRKAAPGTIRGDFSLSNRENLVHGSDSAESASGRSRSGFLSWSYRSRDRVCGRSPSPSLARQGGLAPLTRPASGARSPDAREPARQCGGLPISIDRGGPADPSGS